MSQLKDPSFRRHVLVQCLILFDYLKVMLLLARLCFLLCECNEHWLLWLSKVNPKCNCTLCICLVACVKHCLAKVLLMASFIGLPPRCGDMVLCFSFCLGGAEVLGNACLVLLLSQIWSTPAAQSAWLSCYCWVWTKVNPHLPRCECPVS